MMKLCHPEDSDAKRNPVEEKFPSQEPVVSEMLGSLGFLSHPPFKDPKTHMPSWPLNILPLPDGVGGWAFPDLGNQTKLATRRAEHLDKSGARAAASMPNSRAPLGGEEVRHQVRARHQTSP